MVRCGFREFRVEKGYFRLNGKRIFLRSTHTGNHMPIGQVVPQDPDLMRRDFLMAKVGRVQLRAVHRGHGLVRSRWTFAMRSD